MHKGSNGALSAGIAETSAAGLYSNPDTMEVVQFAPPAALAPFVTQLYFFESNEKHIQDVQPAALGHLVFFLRGGGELAFHDGHVDPIKPASVFGPCAAAATFTLSGPFLDFGVVLSPLGFVALTGKSASDYADRLVDAAELFGDEINMLAARFSNGIADGSLRYTDLVHEITAFLLTRVRAVPNSHITLIQTVAKWISSEFDPDVEELYQQLEVSRSTATRLIVRYFGSPPKPLMRKYRAVRAVTNLCDPQCTPQIRAKIESLFYDQPHMIREIRHFTGRTPGALDSDDSKILRMWLSKDNYRDVDTFLG